MNCHPKKKLKKIFLFKALLVTAKKKKNYKLKCAIMRDCVNEWLLIYMEWSFLYPLKKYLKMI